MKRMLFRTGLALGPICLALAGCGPTHRQAVRSSKPEDPTAWTDADGTGGSKGLPRTSHLQGGLSSEANEIERSLGVGR